MRVLYLNKNTAVKLLREIASSLPTTQVASTKARVTLAAVCNAAATLLRI